MKLIGRELKIQNVGKACEGACNEHDGDIVLVTVYDPTNKKDWGKFWYCETAIENDKNNGFIVNAV